MYLIPKLLQLVLIMLSVAATVVAATSKQVNSCDKFIGLSDKELNPADKMKKSVEDCGFTFEDHHVHT